MAGLLDSDQDLQEYYRRLYASPMGAAPSLDEVRRYRAMTGLTDEMLNTPRPVQLPQALGNLSGLSLMSTPQRDYTPGGGFPATQSYLGSSGDFSGRMSGLPSGNIEDRRSDFSWRDIARLLSPNWPPSLDYLLGGR